MPRTKTSAVDEYIGKQMQALRVKARVSQADLARVLNITFQQVQKFERGENRVSASQLFTVATYLNAPLDQFRSSARSSVKHGSVAVPNPEMEEALKLAETKRGLTLLCEFSKLDEEDRKRLISIARVLAS